MSTLAVGDAGSTLVETERDRCAKLCDAPATSYETSAAMPSEED
jgi:hypothetical protein